MKNGLSQDPGRPLRVKQTLKADVGQEVSVHKSFTWNFVEKPQVCCNVDDEVSNFDKPRLLSALPNLLASRRGSPPEK